MQNRLVTYREIRTTLGISGTSIHSTLHEHFFALDPPNFCQSLKKRLVSIGGKKCFKNTIAVFQNEFREVHPKSVVVPETIDAVRQLKL